MCSSGAPRKPGTEQAVELRGIHPAERTLEGGLAGRFAPAGALVLPGPQRSQVGLRQRRADRREVREGAATGQRTERRAGQHGVEPVTRARTATHVGQLREDVNERGQRRHRQAVARRGLAFASGQRFGQGFRPQPGAGLRVQRLYPQLLGSVVFLVVVFTRSRPTGGAAERLPAGRLVASSPIQLRIDEALDQHHRVAVDTRKINFQPLPSELEQAARKVRAGHAGQDQKTTVLRDQPQAAGSLLRRPVQPLIAHPQVQARAAVAKQRYPRSRLVARDVAQHLAHQGRIVQVVVLLDQLVPAPDLVGSRQFQSHRFKQVLLRGGRVKVAHHPIAKRSRTPLGQPIQSSRSFSASSLLRRISPVTWGRFPKCDLRDPTWVLRFLLLRLFNTT
jgi:hypothetical protein